MYIDTFKGMMRIKKYIKAFSLTELIIVLVIIALLFAAMAPIITKRHIAESGTMDVMWNFVNNDSERNSYFDPGASDWTSSVYVGMNPVANYRQAGKLVINSGSITYNGNTYQQPQLQFRFSPNENELTSGVDAGSLLIGSNDNVYLGHIHNFAGGGNTVLGFNNLIGATNISNSVVAGFGAMKNTPALDLSNFSYIAIGSDAAHSLGLSENTELGGIYVGSQAGAIDTGFGNIAIGYHSLHSSSPHIFYNIAVGAHSGIFENEENNASSFNVHIGSTTAIPNSSSQNIIIGQDSFAPDTDNNFFSNGTVNLTAIGYKACSGINNPSETICLGYKTGSEVNNSFNYNSDEEHILLGGTPQGGFGGRAVMEVHNYGAGTVSPATNADVVLNSNLVLRGKLYAADTDSSQPSNYQLYDSLTASESSTYDPIPSYRCTSDSKINILLVYNTYVCNDDFSSISGFGETSSANSPRSRNVLYKNGSVPEAIRTSDIRLKTNIKENSQGIDKVLKLEPYNYTFKSDPFAKPQVGVIAQDLERIFPESVSKDDKGFLNIRWDEMFYAIINSIKQLSSKVEQLSEKIVDIAKNIDFVNSQQENLRKKVVSLDKRIKRLERK